MLNKCIILGRLTDDPVQKVTTKGTPVCMFQIATTGRRKDANDNYIVSYPDCVAWGKDAEFLCRNFRKGNMIIVTGEYTTRLYTAKDGTSRKVTELNVGSIEFSGEKTTPQA